MAERRSGCGLVLLGILVVGTLYGAWGWWTGRDTPDLTIRGEITVAAASLGPGCLAPGGIMLDPSTGDPVRVQVDRGERDSDACRFSFRAEVPVADRYRVSIPGTGLPDRVVERSVMDDRDATGRQVWTLRVSW